MRICITLCVAVAVASASSASRAGEFSGIGALLPSLVSLRDNCADMAKKASDKHGLDQYQSTLDSETAQNQAQMDARVYGVSHGDRETRDFYLEQLQAAADKGVQDNNRIAAEYARAAKQVTACVQTAETEGKHAYSDLKAEKGVKRATLAEAETLMTAWLANLDEVSVNTPAGSDATAAQWRTAKAHAELSTL